MSKYRNKKVIIDGITFDSKAEGDRYIELKLLQKSGKISNLVLQPEFNYKGETGKKLFKYKADFQYNDGDAVVVEDVKGVRTPVYRIKKKLIEDQFKIEIIEIRK